MAADAETQFKAALDVIQSLPKNGSYKPSPDMMLHFYSLYKQATEGQCNRTKPWAFDVINKAKWEAWNKLGNMSKEEAMKNYVNELTKVMRDFPRPTDNQIIEALPASDKAATFIETLGHFYEIVDPDSENAKEFKKFTESKSSNGGINIPNGDTPTDYNNDHIPVCLVNGAPEQNGDQCCTPDSRESSSDIVCVSENLDVKTGAQETEKGTLSTASNLNESDDEFCDTSADITSFEARHRQYSESHSASTLSSTSHSSSASPGKGKSDIPVNNQPHSRGGEQGTHGIDEPVQLDHTQSGQLSVFYSSPSEQANALLQLPLGSGSAGGSGGDGPPENSRNSEVQERIAVALLQLQRDMHSVLNRLTTLETIAIARQQDMQRFHRSMYESEKQPSWWPFVELSPRTTFFVLIWPFVAKMLMAMWSRSKVRRR